MKTQGRGSSNQAEFVFDASANSIEGETAAEVASRPAEALYFPADAPRLFGCLHLPSAVPMGDTGLVICKPFGYEALCGHRSFRAFAEMAAAAGVPALRFDYLGCGDSANIEPDADQIETWCRDVLAAVDELRARTGVTRVCLLGFRLGALLATLAATRSEAVDGLILVAPVLSGSRYLKEMRTTRLAALLAAGPAESSASEAAEDAAAAAAGSIEISGYWISAATIAALSRVDLATLGAPGVSRMLVIDRDDLPTARRWVDCLAGAGVQAEYSVLPGFVEMMMMIAVHDAVVPGAMLSATRDWLSRFASMPSGTANECRARGGPAVTATATTQLPVPVQGLDGVLTERPVRFGSGGKLFGIVTEPYGGERRRRAVVLPNNGADYHIGAGRLNVALARRWAHRGYVVLRMDLGGLGDSASCQGTPDDQVFPPTAIDDVRIAIEFMREHYRVSDVTVAGLCSGAYHALRAAVAALPMNRILLVNPYFFKEYAATPIDEMHLAEFVQTAGAHRARARSFAHWRRLLTGEVDVVWIMRLYVRRIVASLESAVSEVVRFLRIRLPNDLGWQLERVAELGVQTTIVFSRGEPGIELLRMRTGSALKRMGERCRVHIIDGADHTFSRRSSRVVLEKILSDELFARATGTPAQGL
jgi:alpha-beta hydrolase superfamily lysophospholipase